MKDTRRRGAWGFSTRGRSPWGSPFWGAEEHYPREVGWVWFGVLVLAQVIDAEGVFSRLFSLAQHGGTLMCLMGYVLVGPVRG